jgi:hypothetical protein
MEFSVGFFLKTRLARIGNKIGNILFCFVNIQHIIMLKNGMIVHDNYAMVFVIRPFQSWMLLLLLFFPWFSWWTKWHTMHHICWDLEKFTTIDESISLKKTHILVVWWKINQNFSFTYNWRSWCCCHACASTCKTSSSLSLSPINSLIHSNLTPPSSFPTTL